ncbi:MAG TPA: ABC transporter permease, partial [Anaerolineales bacterium]|nr:ABC transporter permease [Anaerolineales bacterium]
MGATPQETVLPRVGTAPRRLPRWLAAVIWFARKKPLGTAGAVVVLLMGVGAVGAEVLAPYDPLATNYAQMLRPPSVNHWLGTDTFGRDILSRIIYGSRTALLVGFGASFLGATVGGIIGVASAYFGGRVDLVVQRLIDMVMSFPIIVLALAVVAILGSGIVNLTLAIAIPFMPRIARVVRSSALAIRETPYIDAARAMGFGHGRII